VYRSAYRLLECAIPSGEIFVIRRVTGGWMPITASGKPLSGLPEITARAEISDGPIRLGESPAEREDGWPSGQTIAVRQKDNPMELVGLVNADPSPLPDESLDLLVEAAPFIAWLVETAQPSGALPRSSSGRRLAPVDSRVPRGLDQAEWKALRSLEVDGFVKPSKRVGGDFFEVAGLGEDEAVVCLGDVSGKGPQAALLAALARTAFHAAVRERDGPAEILQGMDEILSPTLERVQAFITAVTARIGTNPLTLAYASAGHVEPVLWHAGDEQLELLPATGLPLGVMPGQACGGVKVELAPESILLLYSDGVTEAEDPDGKVLGLQGLSDLIHACHPASAAEQVEMIIAGLDVHCRGIPLRDDVAVLLVRTPPQPGGARRIVPFVIPAEAAALRLLVDLARREVLSAEAVPKAQRAELADALATAVAELAANQIEHAYAGTPGRIQGRLSISHDRLEADLFDSGSEYVGFQPTEFDSRDPPLRGYGLKLIRSLVDDCAYRRLDGSRNHWHLVRYLDRGGGDGDRGH
jgi:sigma-B regulation protein RsbU (phosphoserine phosphatase)